MTWRMMKRVSGGKWRGGDDDRTSQIETTCKSAATAWNGADKVGFIATTTSARELGCRCGDLLFLDLKDGWETRDA